MDLTTVKSLLILLMFASPLALGETPEFKLNIKGHQFAPSEIRIPADKKVKLLVSNEDATSEEFESHALNREKVIPGGSTAVIFIGPLRPGRYPFEGEFNPATAKGAVIAE